jgi:hypothetical protein
MALNNKLKADVLYNLFLSTIIIYKTVKFTEEKYLEILCSLTENYEVIKSMKYGLEDKKIEDFKDQFDNEAPEVIDKILAARYINKILTLVYY